MVAENSTYKYLIVFTQIEWGESSITCQRRKKEPNSVWQHSLMCHSIQHTYYHIIYKQTQFEITSKGVQGWTPNGFLVEIILHIWFKAVLNCFICICKITCKPMGNFAENLNLANVSHPLLLACTLLLDRLWGNASNNTVVYRSAHVIILQNQWLVYQRLCCNLMIHLISNTILL